MQGFQGFRGCVFVGGFGGFLSLGCSGKVQVLELWTHGEGVWLRQDPRGSLLSSRGHLSVPRLLAAEVLASAHRSYNPKLYSIIHIRTSYDSHLY